MASSPLRDRRILVVEDEYLIAMSLQDALETAGSVVLGPVPSVEKAIKTIESEASIDAAVLDVNLGGVLAYPVADMLIARKIPFVFTSGYEDNVLRTRYAEVKNCPKPYQFPAMEEALVEAMSGSLTSLGSKVRKPQERIGRGAEIRRKVWLQRQAECSCRSQARAISGQSGHLGLIDELSHIASR